MIRDRKLKLRFLTQGGARCQTFSSGFHGFGRRAAQAKRGPLKGRTRHPLSFCRGSRAGCNNVDFAGDTPATTDPQVGNPLTSENRIVHSIHKQELASFRSRVPESNQLSAGAYGDGHVVWHPEKSSQDIPPWVTRQSMQVSVSVLGNPVQSVLLK